MQTKIKKISWKRLLKVAALSAVTLAPVAISPTAQADPPKWGNQTRRDYRTLEGVVTRDRNGANFTILTRRDGNGSFRNGDRVPVHLMTGEPRGLDEGDLVRVYGYFPNNRNTETFFATGVTIVQNHYDDRDNNSNASRTLSGTVSSIDRNARRLDVRSDNGVTYTVFSRDRISNNIDRGDRVRIDGNFGQRDRTVRNASVSLLNNTSNNSNDRRTLSGEVTSVDRNLRRFNLRGDGGTSYTVFTQNNIPNSIDRGDRVRIEGFFNFNDRTVRNASVALIENDNDRNDRDFPTDFNGVVTFTNNNDTIRVRASNGQEYTVRTNDAEDYRRGDNVRVRGSITNGVVFAKDIDRR